MVGFRSVVVHAYHEVDLDILRAIVRDHLQDFLDFTRTVLQA